MPQVDSSILPPVTLILFTYNQSSYVAEAMTSCLAQDYSGSLEILCSDDCSTDNTFDILKNLAKKYGGSHRIRLRRNSVNQGIGDHYNTAISEATGDLIFTAAGDDISLPFRVSRIVDAWLVNGCKADLLTSNLRQIDEQGKQGKDIIVSDLSRWKSPTDWIRKRPYVVGAAHAFTPRLHREFGNFLTGLVYEDQVMAMRATMTGGGLKVSEALVLYRQGGVSQKKNSIQNSEDYLSWVRKNYDRQAAQYRQITIDLLKKDYGELTNGRIKRKLLQADLVIALDRSSGLVAKALCTLRHPYCGHFFKLKMLIYLSFPDFAVSIHKLQKKIRALSGSV